MAAQAAPNRKAKTTIWSTSLRAMASMMLVGKMCSSMVPSVAGAGGSGGFGGGALDGHALAGPHQVHGGQAQEQRQRGDDFEIEDGLDADAAHALQIAAAGDADHQRGEDQRRDDGADQPQENVG